MTYSPAAYWNERGKHWEAEARRRGFWDQENPELVDLLRTLTFRSVLEIGRGFGRVGAMIAHHWPEVRYTGIDVSPDLIEGARKRLPNAKLIVGDIATMDLVGKWDIVLAVSTLGHLRPEDVGSVLDRMQTWARSHVVHIDWDQPGASTEFQYGHDYRSLHGAWAEVPMGRQTLFYRALP